MEQFGGLLRRQKSLLGGGHDVLFVASFPEQWTQASRAESHQAPHLRQRVRLGLRRSAVLVGAGEFSGAKRRGKKAGFGAARARLGTPKKRGKLVVVSTDEQLERWVAGEPVHNDEKDECCPDFSCCNPKLLATQEEREKFRGASEDERAAMLSIFLGRMLAAEGVGACVAGGPANYQPQQ